MNITEFIGFTMLFSPFIALFIYMWVESGFLTALFVYFVMFSFMSFIFVGFNLITKGTLL